MALGERFLAAGMDVALAPVEAQASGKGSIAIEASVVVDRVSASRLWLLWQERDPADWLESRGRGRSPTYRDS